MEVKPMKKWKSKLLLSLPSVIAFIGSVTLGYYDINGLAISLFVFGFLLLILANLAG